MTKDSKWRYVIALWQIIGGAIGVFLTLPLSIRYASVSAGAALVGLTFLAIYTVSVIAGLLLWQNKLSGYTLSAIIQALQIPRFTLLEFVYQLTMLGMFIIGIHQGRPYFAYTFGNIWRFGKLVYEEPTLCAINVGATIATIYLLVQRSHFIDHSIKQNTD